jgi:DNA-binding CsgD family transcriptional regulator
VVPSAGLGFTRREEQIASLLAQGYTDREIARIAGITTSTVRCHLRNIREKLGLKTRVRVAAHVWHIHLPRSPDQST